MQTSPAPTNFSLPFLRHEQLSIDAYAFYFDTTQHPVTFLPGQYTRVILPHENMDIRGDKRYFSIAVSPNEKTHIRVVTRVIQSSFKKALLSLVPGTIVALWGPVGRFVFDPEETSPHVFLAGGIGITPFLSIIPFALENNVTTPITLFVSFSTQEEVILHDYLLQLAGTHPTIKIVYTITHPEGLSPEWKGETGRISAEMIKKYAGNDLSPALFFMSGPPVMVTAMEEIVKGMGVLQERIKKENFAGY